MARRFVRSHGAAIGPRGRPALRRTASPVARHMPGRVRVALAALLSKETGRQVNPEDVVPATGWWRTDCRADCYRWEIATGPSKLVLGSWDTMTECVRNGITVDLKAGEVYAKDSNVRPS